MGRQSGPFPLIPGKRFFHAGFQVVLLLCVLSGNAWAADDPLTRLRDETLSYFKPLKGQVLSVQGTRIRSDLGAQAGVRPGMRFSILREGEPFLHPVTKEKIGKTEANIGSALVKEASPDGSVLEVDSGEPQPGDILRISDVRLRVLFFQDKGVDWGLAEHYYRLLKESGRVDLVDTPLDGGEDSAVLKDARDRSSSVALLLRSRPDGNGTVLVQRLYWVSDGARISEMDAAVDQALLKELHFGEGMLSPMTAAGDAIFFYDLPFVAQSVGSGDIDGDGKAELILTRGRDIMVYALGSSLTSRYTYRGHTSDEYIWIDTFDIDSDGKDEIVVTSLRSGEIVSSVISAKEGELVQVWKGNFFLRRLGSGLIAQSYEHGHGFSGRVFAVRLEGGDLKKGEDVSLPKGVNIYDFAFLQGLDGARYILAYDDADRLNLYSSDGIRVWVGKDELGGFQTAVKRDAPTIMVDRGSWTVKDRLVTRGNEALLIKRVPLANVARGLGYKSSQVKALLWSGLSMDERTLIEGISGSVLDYSASGEWLVVLSKPLFGIKAGKILEGKNPLGTMLYVYSLKGR